MTRLAFPVDAIENDAQIVRQMMASLVGSVGGVVSQTGLAVTQKGTPDMHVLVQGGTPAEGGAWIPSINSSSGPYYFQNTASFELPIVAAGATNPRIDTVIARVYDTAVDASGKTEALIESLKGTEEAGATLGNLKGIAAIPKGAITLAYVEVKAKVTSILTANILDQGQIFGGVMRTASRGNMSYGYVAEGGSLIFSSGDFTVAKTGTGVYEVKWSPEKPAVYTVQATPANATPGAVGVSLVSAAKCVVNIQVPAGTPANSAFMLTAIGFF